MNIQDAKYKSVTQYPRSMLTSRIVHIGFGAFHRGHQAVYNDLTNELDADKWGIFEINMFGDNALIDQLNTQDNLFTVVETSATETNTRLVRTLTGAIHTPRDGIQAAIQKLLEPQVALVSLTITEKGYCADPSSRKLDITNPLIAHDLQNPSNPLSAIGLITEALRLRKVHNLAPFSVMSCDNIPENGHLTKDVVLEFAAKLNSELAAWIQEYVTFPNTMVDRIVPAMTDASFAQLEASTGFKDLCGVVCEDFRQWVIEDNFVAGRPNWNVAGAMFVDDVLPYEEMKLRMLNGSHSFLAYNGGLAGYEFIYECMEDEHFRNATRKLMLDEQAKSLNPALKVDVEKYAELLITRFSNQNVKHKTAQIAMDGSQKLPQRALDPFVELQHRDIDAVCLPITVAGWMHSIINAEENAEIIHDPLAPTFSALSLKKKDGVINVEKLLEVEKIFGQIKDNPTFTKKVKEAFVAISETGIQSVIKSLSH